MLFQRRGKPKRWWRNILWPHNGWRRAVRYIGYRVLRLSAAPSSIATGVACGVAVSFTPFFGLHIILAAAMSRLGGGNVIAAVLATIVGNPWTLPFILWLNYQTGLLFLPMVQSVDIAAIPISMQGLFDHFWSLFLPTMVGCIPYVILSWWISFVLTREIIQSFQDRRGIKRS